MAKIIQFRQISFFNLYKSRLTQSISRLNQTIENPDSTFQSKMEAKMVRSILEFDDSEFERTTTILRGMKDKKMRVIE
jgi:hypothetical protein